MSNWTEDDYRAAFFKKVNFDKESGCWEWTAAKSQGGYGVFRYHGRNAPAHRVSYEWVNGGVLPGMYILHKCDNRICVNPDHLVSGSPSDNMRDMHAKRRHPRPNVQKIGEGNSKALLTEAQVVDIRKRRREGVGYMSMAEELGVSEATVRLAAEGKRWAYLPGAIQAEERKSLSLRGKLVRGENNVNAKLTAEKVREIRSRAAAGELPSKFHAEYGIALSTACDIIKGRIWRDT